ncbi:hypothetical protein ZIOFF_050436 [Zingiber officinale]|uniref:Uncharacterized protein n=1 Tax=Zingiber officinale TaxID=94328 RepID=A0A8J5FRM1_ZINOF|nr:hypothetical protein ZIOFF_050436 [Zingiber officinale]
MTTDFLRACFGTTKYCCAWLSNLTCSNPDCLYLHDIGNQEDSFTKHETISAYTWCSSDAPNPVKGSLPNSSLGNQCFTHLLHDSSMQCSETLARQNVETSKRSTLPSALMKNPIQPPEKLDEVATTSKEPESNIVVSAWDDDTIVIPKPKEDVDDSFIGCESIKSNTVRHQPTSLTWLPTQFAPKTTDVSHVFSSCLSNPLVETLEHNGHIINLSNREMFPRNSTMLKCHVTQLSNSDPDTVDRDSALINGVVHSLGLGSLSVKLDRSTTKQVNVGQHQTLASSFSSVVLPQSRDFFSDLWHQVGMNQQVGTMSSKGNS